MKVSGIIDSITSKTVSNGGTVYNALIDGQEINLGFNNPYTEGEYAEIEVESTKWGLQVPRNAGKSGGGSVPSKTPFKAGSGATPRTQSAPVKQAFPVDPNSKDHSIIRQNALTNANTCVGNALTAGLLKGVKTKDDYYNEVITLAYNLSQFAMGTMDRKLVEEANKRDALEAAEKAEA